MGDIADHRRVVAGDEGEVRADLQAQLAHAVDGAGGVLDTDDIGQLRQAHDRVVAHVDDGAARHVVEHDRDLDIVVQGLEMLVQPPLATACCNRARRPARHRRRRSLA